MQLLRMRRKGFCLGYFNTFSFCQNNCGSPFILIVSELNNSLLILVFIMVIGLISLTFLTKCTPKYLQSPLVHGNRVEINVFVNLDL